MLVSEVACAAPRIYAARYKGRGSDWRGPGMQASTNIRRTLGRPYLNNLSKGDVDSMSPPNQSSIMVVGRGTTRKEDNRADLRRCTRDPKELSQDGLWEAWEEEANAMLAAKDAGTVVAIYKVCGQRLILVLLDVESPDELDHIWMAALPMARHLELKQVFNNMTSA
jgi:muconolactone D-isomerase